MLSKPVKGSALGKNETEERMSALRVVASTSRLGILATNEKKAHRSVRPFFITRLN
jgi:hypothetical protein